jgi:hypothetical protein
MKTAAKFFDSLGRLSLNAGLILLAVTLIAGIFVYLKYGYFEAIGYPDFSVKETYLHIQDFKNPYHCRKAGAAYVKNEKRQGNLRADYTCKFNLRNNETLERYL